MDEADFGGGARVKTQRRARRPARNPCNQAGDCDAVFSYPMFRDLEKSQTVFTDIAAHGNRILSHPITRQPFGLAS